MQKETHHVIPPWPSKLLEKHQDNICGVRGRKTSNAMHLGLSTFCILPVFPNIKLEKVLHRSFVDLSQPPTVKYQE